MTINLYIPALITFSAGVLAMIIGYFTVMISFGSLRRLNWIPVGIYLAWLGAVVSVGAIFIQVSHWI